MADNKKSIIVYADWIDKFEELEDDEAGRLIKHFFRYVNDLNPEYPDRTTKLMFIDIKNTLKRDLDKWEEKGPQRVEKARLAGIASAEARKLKKQLNSTNELKNELNSTKPTVSVSVSVNDNVNESDNVKEKNISNSSFKNTLLKNENWKKSISSEFKISIEEVEIKLNVFEKHLFDEQKFHPSMNEFTKHFKYWFPVNKSKNGKSTTTTGIPTASFSKNR